MRNIAAVIESRISPKRDPSTLFLDTQTQHILKSISQFKLHKIFRREAVINDGTAYKLMTDAELDEKLHDMIDSAHQRIQMTPVVQVNDGANRRISSDASLQGFSNTNFIVTDVTYGFKTSLEKVVARQLSGNLKYPSLGTSKRITQAYLPIDGRNVRIPNMFKHNELEKSLNERKYEFVLDRLSVQYEPYEKEYHDISAKVYMHINKNAGFEDLRSTRHFGPMAFFLAWHKCIDDILYDMMKRHFLKNCVEIIALMYKLNSIDEDYENILLQLDELQNTAFEIKDLKKCFYTNRNSYITNSNFKTDSNNFLNKGELVKTYTKFIDNYIQRYGLKKVQLKIALHTLNEENTFFLK